MAGRRLAERQEISGTTDGAELVNGLKNREQVEVKATKVEHVLAISWWGGAG